MKQNLLLISGIATGSLLGVSLYYRKKQQKQNTMAASFLEALERLIDPSSSGLGDAFDMHYKAKVLQSAGGKVLVLSESAAQKNALDIKNAWGFWDDDETKIYHVFRKLKDKVQVSQVAAAYAGMGEGNLIDILKSKLWESELKKVMHIVGGLPSYRLA